MMICFQEAGIKLHFKILRLVILQVRLVSDDANADESLQWTW